MTTLISVYVRELPAHQVGYRVLADGRHVLDINDDISVYVRPDRDGDLAAVTAGLRKLAAAATEMAEALSSHGGAS